MRLVVARPQRMPWRVAGEAPTTRATAAWSLWWAGLSLLCGVALGVQSAGHLPTAQRAALAADVSRYVRAGARGEIALFWPALAAWLRSAAPVWSAGLWPRVGVLVVAFALGLHGYSLGVAFGAAAPLGPAGMMIAVLAVLPGNVFGLPTLVYVASRAATLAWHRGGREPIPPAYLWLGACALGGIGLGGACEAMLAPVLLHVLSASL